MSATAERATAQALVDEGNREIGELGQRPHVRSTARLREEERDQERGYVPVLGKREKDRIG